MSGEAQPKPRRRRPPFLTQPTVGWKPYALLTLFCAVLFLPGIASLPPLDRDEARFAQATAQMLETRDFVDIRFQDQPRHKKPAGIHWLQAASVTLLSAPEAREIWAYRVPSVLGAWLAVMFTFATGATLFGRQAGLIAGGMLAASLLVITEAHQAKTDAVLLATVAAAQFALARVYVGGAGFAAAAGFWLALAAGILVKGPIAPLVAGLTIAAVAVTDKDRSWLRRLGWWWGLPLMAALAAPWFLLVGGKGGGGFVATAVTTDLIPKLLGAEESHGAPPGVYTALMPLFFWPAALFAPIALWRAWRDRASAPVRFCLAWLVPAWLLFELVPTKLPHYVLPLYPALALVTARALAMMIEGAAPWPRRPAVLGWGALWCLVLLALCGAAAYAPLHFGAAPDWRTALFAVFGIYFAVNLVSILRRRAAAEAAETTILAGGFLVMLVLWLAFTRLDPMWVSRDAARAIADHYKDAPRPPVAAAGYAEPSLVFLLGTATKLTDGAGAAAHLLANPAAAAVVEGRELEAFNKALGGEAAAFREIAAPRGLNYSKGKPVTLHLFVSRR